MPANGALKALEGKAQKDYENFVLGVKALVAESIGGRWI